jgi:hypothetical protein
VRGAVHVAFGKLGSRDASPSSLPGISCGVWAAATGDSGSSEAPERAVTTADRSAVPAGRLFFLKDTISGLNFLVDTGSSYNILPHKSCALQAGPVLWEANGRRIRCWGQKQAGLKLDGTAYTWRFLLAGVKFPILGVDFLRQFQLLVDEVGGQLLPRHAGIAAVAAAPTCSSVAGPVQPDCEFSALLQQFPAVAQPFSVSTTPHHCVEHHIVTRGRLAAAKAEFDQILKARVVRHSSSGWASPLHMVRKKDGGWRPCGDFHRLNVQFADDKYPLPNMGDLAGRLVSGSSRSRRCQEEGGDNAFWAL